MSPSITIISSLFRCAQYLEGYLQALARIDNASTMEVLLLHNEPSDVECDIIRQHMPRLLQSGLQVRHIIIEKREGLYCTWNRAIRESRGEFLAVWNVDDIRTAASLMHQRECLKRNPDAVLCYGSYIGVQRYGEHTGSLYTFPEFSTFRFLRSCLLTPFPMWRKSLHERIGNFDEGFRSAGDYDFQLRAARDSSFARLDEVVGYYLEAPETGISKTGDINNIERTLCEFRYGIFDKINVLYLPAIKRYSMKHLQWNESLHKLECHFHDYKLFLALRSLLAPLAILRIPINLLRFIKHRILPRIIARTSSAQNTMHLRVAPVPVSRCQDVQPKHKTVDSRVHSSSPSGSL